jgi:hypothetical protein
MILWRYGEPGIAHNFMTDMHYTVSHWMMAGLQGSHDAGTGMNLFEGNVGNAFVMDTYHGTGNLATLFRNRLTGTEGTKTANTIPVNIFAYNRFVNVIGNVLGMPGHHHVYESSRSSSGPRASSYSRPSTRTCSRWCSSRASRVARSQRRS